MLSARSDRRVPGCTLGVWIPASGPCPAHPVLPSAADTNRCSSAPCRQGAGGGRGRSDGVSSPGQSQGPSVAQPSPVSVSVLKHPGLRVSDNHPETPATSQTRPHPEDMSLRKHSTLLPQNTFYPMTHAPNPLTPTPCRHFSLEDKVPCHLDILLLRQHAPSQDTLTQKTCPLSPPQGYVSPQDTPGREDNPPWQYTP